MWKVAAAMRVVCRCAWLTRSSKKEKRKRNERSKETVGWVGELFLWWPLLAGKGRLQEERDKRVVGLCIRVSCGSICEVISVFALGNKCSSDPFPICFFSFWVTYPLQLLTHPPQISYLHSHYFNNCLIPCHFQYVFCWFGIYDEWW